MLTSVLALTILAADPPLDLCCGAAYGFPQADATVLYREEDLRVSAWNNNEYLFVQAVLYTDHSNDMGETDDGREIGDTSNLMVDADGDGKPTTGVDRTYSLNPWPSLPGLHYSVVLSERGSTGLQRDSKGRGAITYPVGREPGQAEADAGPIRIDTYLIPLAELGERKPGDTIKFVYWASSTKPRTVFNSVGFKPEKPHYWPHEIPRESWHSFVLASHDAKVNLELVPEDRKAQVEASAPVKKFTQPPIGKAPPEVTAADWLNAPEGVTPSIEAFKGKVVVVEFWATWCGPCVAAIPHINEVIDRNSADGLVVMSLTDQPRNVVDKFIESRKLTMKAIVGCKSNAVNEYGVTGIPQAFIIGRDGMLRWAGHPGTDEFERQIKLALAD